MNGPRRELLYLIGQPGSGKSTLAAALTEGARGEPLTQPFAHTVWHAGPGRIVHELGPRREGFAGTDGLSMSVQPKVFAWLAGYQGCDWDMLVLGEGDRLANMKFFNAVLGLGWRLTVARLFVSGNIAEQRRRARAAELGIAAQNPTWLKGRVSKTHNLARALPPELLLDLEADGPPERVLEQLVASGNPVARALRA